MGSVEAPTPTPKTAAQKVGDAFVLMYYGLLHRYPEMMHKFFYSEVSTLSRQQDDGSVCITTTIDGIHEKILSFNYGNYRTELRYVDAQESSCSGVLVLVQVIGNLIRKDNKIQSFTQRFFLAPQAGSYFVLNDILRIIETGNQLDGKLVPVIDVYNLPENVVITLKKSSSSIVMDLNGRGVAFSPPALEYIPKSQEQAKPPPTHEADGYSIYVKNLPINSTISQLENEFNKFGSIRNGGIQVRSNRGCCFGFVQFEAPNAVEKALEASPITIGGRQVVVEEKRSTNSQGFSRAGVKLGGVRGCGNYGDGGRGFNNQGDFNNNRNEFGEFNNRGHLRKSLSQLKN